MNRTEQSFPNTPGSLTWPVPVVFPGQVDEVSACLFEGGEALRRVPAAHLVERFLSARERETIPPEQPNPDRRFLWILARIAGKCAIMELLRKQGEAAQQLDLSEIEITSDKNGAPVAHIPAAAATRAAHLNVSLAHSGSMAAAAAAFSPIGIDVEALARVPEFGWAKIAVESEMKLIEGAPHRISGLATPLLQLWTAKEAASKAARVGLADGGLVRWRLIAVGLNRGWLVEDQRTRLHYGVHSAAKGQWLLACASRHR